MKVSMDGENEVVIIFDNGELEDFKELAMSQGWSLPAFVSHAVAGYFRLLIDVKGA